MRKALVVGINNYPNNPLNGCVNDAYAVAEILRTNSNGDPNFEVMLSVEGETQSSLMSNIKTLFKGDSDVALLYFSGHGSSDGSIVTIDAQRNNLGVKFDEILKEANQSKCRNKVIILDCCFSGAFGEIGALQGTQSLLSEGVTIITASNNDETSIEINGHGLFTSLLLEALRGGAADISGRITPASIYSFIDQSLGSWGQRPLFKTNTNSFVSLRDVAPKVDKSILRKLPLYFESASDCFDLNPSFEFSNDPSIEHMVKEPYADTENVEIFKNLQLMVSAGLIEPYEEEYMYYAAMNSKSCKLTSLGLHYWNLTKKGKI